MRHLLRYLAVAAAIFPVAFTLFGAVATPPCASLTGLPANTTAVVLGAKMDDDGRLHASTLGRVAAGVDLYHTGLVTRLHMTGGRGVEDGPSAGGQMAAEAVSLGTPAAAITAETESLSTVQNALFSRPMLQDAGAIVLVSHGYHLPRAWVSFAWAGVRPDAVCHSARMRHERTAERAPLLTLGREYLAFWFNLGRVGLYSLARAAGLEADPRWLR